GTDSLGREWRNGELVAAKDEPTQQRPAAQPESTAQPTAAVPEEESTPRLKPEEFDSVIGKSMDELKLYVEFQDGVIDMHRLYDEDKRRAPGLSVEEFHDGLKRLRDERKVELHKLNEVHKREDGGKAIWENDRLYYYVMKGTDWKP